MFASVFGWFCWRSPEGVHVGVGGDGLIGGDEGELVSLSGRDEDSVEGVPVNQGEICGGTKQLGVQPACRWIQLVPGGERPHIVERRLGKD